MRSCLYGAILTAAVLACMSLSAQDAPAPQDTARDGGKLPRLKVEIEELQRQIQHEKETFAKESLAFSEELERLGAQRDGLLLTIESLRDEVARLTQANAQLQKQNLQAETRLKRERAFLAQIHDFLAQSVSELGELVDISLPGSDSETLSGKFSKLTELSGEANGKPVEAAKKLFELADRLLARSWRMDLYSAETLTGAGTEKQARFARIGEITSLYVTQDEEEAGMLLRCATEEGMRRYERSLPGGVHSAIRGMFEAAGSPEPGIVHVPLDVSQDMVVGVSYGDEGLVAYLARGGPVIVPLLLVAALAIALIGERLYTLRREGRAATKFAGEIVSTYRAKGLQSALALAGGGRGALSSVLRAGLEKVGAPTEVFEEAMREAALAQMGQLERFLSTIAVLATVAPLLGLLGTVTGMITAFDNITAYGTSDPRLLSGGISEALITTMVGLIIAIPVLLMHAFLSAKVDRITADLEESSLRLAAAVAEETGRQGEAGEGAGA